MSEDLCKMKTKPRITKDEIGKYICMVELDHVVTEADMWAVGMGDTMKDSYSNFIEDMKSYDNVEPYLRDNDHYV